MAVDMSNKYGARAEAPSASYPLGSFKNDSTGSANDGTPVDKDWANDILGFLQAMLSEAGIAASGAPDTAVNSQYLTAMKAVVTTLAPSLFEARMSALNGYLVTPVGVIIQWGTEDAVPWDVVGSRDVAFVFGKVFPTQCFVVSPFLIGPDAQAATAWGKVPTTAGVTVHVEERTGVVQSLRAGYIAIGY